MVFWYKPAREPGRTILAAAVGEVGAPGDLRDLALGEPRLRCGVWGDFGVAARIGLPVPNDVAEAEVVSICGDDSVYDAGRVMSNGG